MRSSTKGIIGIAMALSLMLPAVTLAAGLTSAQISSVIGLLQSFGVNSQTINTVQAVLNNTPGQWANASSTGSGMPPPPPGQNPPGQQGTTTCLTLPRNLGIGSEGADVKDLQEMLSQDSTNGFTASSTGYFGPQTAKALARFQEVNGIASSTTGFAGPLTRSFFGRRCGQVGAGQQGGQ